MVQTAVAQPTKPSPSVIFAGLRRFKMITPLRTPRKDSHVSCRYLSQVHPVETPLTQTPFGYQENAWVIESRLPDVSQNQIAWSRVIESLQSRLNRENLESEHSARTRLVRFGLTRAVQWKIV